MAQEICRTNPKFDRSSVLCDLVDGNYSKYKNSGSEEIDKILSLIEKYDQPLDTINYEQMEKYGYKWTGMIPVGLDVAMRMKTKVYKLYPNGSEKRVIDPVEMEEWAKCGGMFGIVRDEQIRYLANFVNEIKDIDFDEILKSADRISHDIVIKKNINYETGR